MRIILAGSSDRSRSSVMFAAKMSRARLNTGPLNQVATGRGAGRGSAPLTSRGVRTGTLASRTSSSGIELDLEGLALAWAGPTAAPTVTVLIDERRGDGDQRAGERRLRRHF